MRKRGILKPTKKEIEEIGMRKNHWRRLREQKPIIDVEEESEAGDVNIDVIGCMKNTTASEFPQRRRDREKE